MSDVTWFESVIQVGHQVVLLEDQRPVQVGDGQIGQRAQTLDHKLLRLLLTDVSRQVPDVFLPADGQLKCVTFGHFANNETIDE